ncbi:CLUMA_CG004066, isoform A [Clunio marinus]|uniref:CLUMA_CG004066, isoform A n=1 Tax=Clunio marinus TaxID=568069 RepID=A0A1J1HRX1_9DIPT|nr:CLUMA_CG004066, isoform A [Clunio marinus]
MSCHDEHNDIYTYSVIDVHYLYELSNMLSLYDYDDGLNFTLILHSLTHSLHHILFTCYWRNH